MNEDATSRLNSWKEIAAYLNRTARTAQRWERDEALPVHRHPHDKRDSVFAFPEELERWLASRKERLQYKAAADPDASAASKPLAIGGWPARGWLWPLAAGLAAVLIAAAAFIPWRDWLGLRPSLDFGPQNLVLTAEFQNQTGEPVFNDSLGTAFAVALQQSTHASLLPRARIEAALRRMGKDARTRIDERTGREICVRENVRALIAPQITEAGEKYALTARLIDPQTGIAVQAYYETAGGRDRVLDALGRLARRIRSGLGESLASIQRTDLPLPQVTTSSLQALRYYAEAQRAWSARQYERAQKLYAAAIEEDPEFAMAHAAYAGALFGPVWSDPVKGRKHYEIALGLADRVTEPERLRMRAMYHQYAGELEKAQEAYELYLQAYPDDATTHFNLGTMLMQHQHPEDAIPELKEAVRIAPNDANAWVNLAASELMSGDAGAAIPLYQRAFALEPSWPLKGSLNHEYGFALAAAGNLWKAEDLFEQALGQPAMRIPALRSLALLDMLQGKYTAAKAHLGEAIRMDSQDALRRARNQLYLAILLEDAGDRAGELRALDAAARLMDGIGNEPVFLTARTGTWYARAGAFPQAQHIRRKLQPLVNDRQEDQSADLHQLDGEIAAARGDYKTAAVLLSLANRESPNTMALQPLARVHAAAGDRAQALASYQQLIAAGGRTLGWEPQQAWLDAHVCAAELYLERGDRERARQALAPVAALWKDADPALPLARRIAKLRQELRPR